MLDQQQCIQVSDEKCCLEGRTIFIPSSQTFMSQGETYYVTTRCENYPTQKVNSVYFFDELTDQRDYFTYLGLYENTAQIFEYICPSNQLCKPLVIDATCCAEVSFSRVNPIFYTRDLTIDGEIPLEQLYDTETISISSSYRQEFDLSGTVIVGPSETVFIAQTPKQICKDAIVIPGTITTTITTTIITSYFYKEVFVAGRVREKGNTAVKLKVNSLETNFKDDFTFNGVELVSDSEIITYMNDLGNIKNINLAAVEADKLRNFRNLPVQPVSDNLIMLDIPFDSSNYDRLFQPGTKYLRQTVQGDLTTLLITSNGFLGVAAFKHNFVVFDPRPYVTVAKGERPLFPGYDPIYSKRTYEEILEHIYTTVYPTTNVPAFPNFRIGDFAINGEIYNPMYDYRNFRLFGAYDVTKKVSQEGLFISEPLTSLDSRFVTGRYIKLGSGYYRISLDAHNSSAKNTSIFGGIIQKVLPVNTKFEPVSKTLYDLNSSYQIIL